MKATIRFRKKLLASLITASVIAVATAPSVSFAQSADASLRGKAPAGATITAKNVATGSTRRTTASSDGSYALVGLQPGTYTVDAGAGTERTVQVVGGLHLLARPDPGRGARTVRGQRDQPRWRHRCRPRRWSK